MYYDEIRNSCTLIDGYQLIAELFLMILKTEITDVFCVVDEFVIEFNKHLELNSIGNKPKRKPRLSISEVMTIMILFQLSGIKCFKWFYNQY